ncbi:TPA: hypothetical protein JDY31_17570 [Citrobacter freundii]|nr:hypothetical protein [Klebsiella pneumoniae]HAU4449210.1 hypothetical protein [Citrobacter freundii]HDP6948041.1 hypothetical protein [Escherichia coli]HAU4515554.1 hypothetical protein [Citrobacter freundii]HAU4769980.1 hypothetical protein [Citrobacter freundii]
MEHSGILFVITGLSIISAIYCMYEMQKKSIKTMSVPAATLLIIAALSSYTVYTEAPKMVNGDAHLNTVLEHHPLPKPVTKDSHWQGLEVAYLSATIKAIESGRAIPDEGMEVAKINMWLYNKEMAGKLNVVDWDGKGRELDISRVLRYQEWQKCENEVSKKQGDPRMCFPPWSIASGHVHTPDVE